MRRGFMQFDGYDSRLPIARCPAGGPISPFRSIQESPHERHQRPSRHPRRPADGDLASRRPDTTTRRRSTETKASYKTTEFFAYLAAVVGVLIAAGLVDEANNGGLGAKQAWLYVTILTAGYMVSRGLAKSGSRDPYTEDRS